IRDAKFRLPRARTSARIGELGFRGIDRGDVRRSATRDHLFGEGPVTAADINPGEAFWRVEPFEKLCADDLAPTAHQPLIDLAVVEEACCVVHVLSPLSPRITVRSGSRPERP